MQVTTDLFREVLGRLASGVTIVTTRDAAGDPRGCTATAVCSVSLDPPLVLAAIGRDSITGRSIRSSGRYALNFLPATAREVAQRFASTEEGKFGSVEWREGADGCPLLAVCLSWVECEVEREVQAGDHTIFLGRVRAASVETPAGEPLIHYHGRFRTLDDRAGQ